MHPFFNPELGLTLSDFLYRNSRFFLEKLWHGNP
jgi:hypothetical protein